MTTMSHSRHLSMFDPNRFGRARVDIVGCGAVGSRIAMEIAKLGVKNLHLWDGDVVENHNIANQLFAMSDIGKGKAQALADEILRVTGEKADVHQKYINDTEEMGQIVFLAVDTMSARKNIFEKSLHLKPVTKLVVEVRMGVEELRVYQFNPCSRSEVNLWKETLVDDKETLESACGARTTVGATAMITAGLAVQKFLQYYKREIERDPKHAQATHTEWLMLLRPLMAFTKGE